MLSQALALTKQENSEQLENLLITFDNSKKFYQNQNQSHFCKNFFLTNSTNLDFRQMDR